MTTAHINQIGTALPPYDVHASYIAFTRKMLNIGNSERVFDRMAQRSGIAHRYSVLPVDDLSADQTGKPGFYSPGSYPSTAQRMKVYESYAPGLAERAVEALDLQGQTSKITHLVVASCTGFVAPGLDHILARRLGLRPTCKEQWLVLCGRAWQYVLRDRDVCAEAHAR